MLKFLCLHPSLYLLVSWAYWDWPLTWLTNHRPSVLWCCWLGHMTHKIVFKMTYNVSSGTFNPTIPYPITYSAGPKFWWTHDHPNITSAHPILQLFDWEYCSTHIAADYYLPRAMKWAVAGNVLQLVMASVCLSARCLQRPRVQRPRGLAGASCCALPCFCDNLATKWQAWLT